MSIVHRQPYNWGMEADSVLGFEFDESHMFFISNSCITNFGCQVILHSPPITTRQNGLLMKHSETFVFPWRSAKLNKMPKMFWHGQLFFSTPRTYWSNTKYTQNHIAWSQSKFSGLHYKSGKDIPWRLTSLYPSMKDVSTSVNGCSAISAFAILHHLLLWMMTAGYNQNNFSVF